MRTFLFYGSFSVELGVESLFRCCFRSVTLAKGFALIASSIWLLEVWV